VSILIDECVPRLVKRFLIGHDARTVQELGYSSYKNGDLLRFAEGKYELFITADQNLRYQQNLTGRQLAIIMLSTNKKSIVKASADKILEAVTEIKPSEFRELFL
jgi:predicted nuclease of predicted toxin-antitoxin system